MSCDSTSSRSEKRCCDDQAENQDLSPPKILVTTPRTRSRTPLVERNDVSEGKATPASRTRNKSPKSQKRSATMANLTPRSKSKSLVGEDMKSTPTLRSRAKNLSFEKQDGNSTPVLTPRSRDRTLDGSKLNTPMTRSRSQTPASNKKDCIVTPRRAKSTVRENSKTRSKIPLPASKTNVVKKNDGDCAETSETSKNEEPKLQEEDRALDNSQAINKPIEKQELETLEDISENKSERTAQNESDCKDITRDICTPVSSDEITQSASDLSGTTENSVPEVKKELQTEMDKVKRRRSTLGRSRKSIQSLGGRRSLCAAVPVLSLQDQVTKIPKDLPQTSKVSQLLDICIREALRRVEERLGGDECVSDLRLDLMTQSEDIAGQVSYAIAGQPLVAEDISNAPSKEGIENNYDKMVAYKKKTAELEEEYKAWKTLMKQRKVTYQASEREYREAKSGETKIEEDQIREMTSAHRNLLASRPNYHQYIQELQTVRERAMLMLQEVKHTSEVVSSFINTSKAEAESCYAAVEELSFGFLKNQPLKNRLKSLIEPNQIAIQN